MKNVISAIAIIAATSIAATSASAFSLTSTGTAFGSGTTTQTDPGTVTSVDTSIQKVCSWAANQVMKADFNPLNTAVSGGKYWVYSTGAATNSEGTLNTVGYGKVTVTLAATDPGVTFDATDLLVADGGEYQVTHNGTALAATTDMGNAQDVTLGSATDTVGIQGIFWDAGAKGIKSVANTNVTITVACGS